MLFGSKNKMSEEKFIIQEDEKNYTRDSSDFLADSRLTDTARIPRELFLRAP